MDTTFPSLIIAFQRALHTVEVCTCKGCHLQMILIVDNPSYEVMIKLLCLGDQDVKTYLLRKTLMVKQRLVESLMIFLQVYDDKISKCTSMYRSKEKKICLQED